MVVFDDEAVIYAVRYCLGRCSIGALGFLGDVAARAGGLGDRVRSVLARDVREWLRMDEVLETTRCFMDRDARRAAEDLLQALEGVADD